MKKNFWSYSTIFCSLLTIIVHAGQPQEQTPQATPRRRKIIHALRIDKSIQLSPGTLAYYASQNNLESFRETLRQHPKELNSLDNRGLTPLQEAVCAGSKDIVEELCTAADLNINIEQYSNTGCTALHYAIEYASLCSCEGEIICNRCIILNFILDYYRSNGIKDPNPVMQSRYRIRYYIPFIYKPLDEWLTPLHIAAIRGDQKHVKLLLENGADPNKLTYGQISPLHYAAYYCGNGLEYSEIASLLCRNRAQVDQKDRYYTTPLAMAIRSCITESDPKKSEKAKEKMVTYLLQQGADVNHRDMLGTPLTQSVKKSSPEGIILALLDAHADTQATDRDGRTALDLTITGDNPQEKIQRTLMHLNARLTLQRTELESNRTKANWVLFPIHEAADSGDLARVKSLLRNKCTRHLTGQDTNRKYPLHYAVRHNHKEIVYYLLTKNDKSHNSTDIVTHPIADAIELGLYDMIEILLDRLPKNYLTIHGEQLLDYIITCKQKNKEILEKEKAGTITIDSVQYSMDTLADWYDAIARLLVTRGANKRNLFKWAIVNKLPLLTTYLVEKKPEVLKDRTEPELTTVTHIIHTNQQHFYPERFPLHSAAYNGDLTNFKSILEQLPQESYIQQLREQDNNGQSPLEYAIRNGHESIIKYILTLCKSFVIIDELRTQVITTAIEYGSYRTVEISLPEAPAEYLSQLGEQLLNYIVTCNHTLPNEVKKDNITIDGNQYSMNTVIDCRDAIALLLVKHGATKNNLLKWAIFNKLSLLTTYLPKILKDRTDGQDALQLAINSQDPVMMELLITHGALRGENDIYLGIIQKLVDQQGLKDVYLNLVDPRTIARSLHGTNPQDNTTKSFKINKTYLNTINLQGMVEPALSSDLGKENYSGYYALYNAVCWAQGYGDTGQLNPISIKRREAFIPFFESMLTFLHEHINPPYDKLTLEHIDLLIQYIRNSSAPVSQETLKNIALIDLSDVELVMQEVLAKKTSRTQDTQPSKLSQKRRELYDRYAGVFDRFTAKQTNKIAVIVTSKNYPSLWFTVCFQRNSDSSVTFQIYDSINPIELWEQDSVYRMYTSGIIQLWYMATHTREQWQEIFTPEIQKSIKAIRSRIEARNPKKPVAEFLRDLDIFIDALGGLQESAKDYQISTTKGKEFAFIHTLRYARFYQEYEIFYYTLLSLRDSKTISGPIAQKADEFIEKHMSIGEIEKALTLLAHEQYASLEERNKAWHTVIAKIQSTIQETLTLKTALAQQARTPIDKEMVSIVEHNLHDELRLVVNDLKKKTDDKSTRILLYGEPGTGKTTFGQVIAQLCPYTEDSKQEPRQFLIFRIPLIGTKYKFSIQEKLTELKNYIRENPHAVIILDELDALSDNDATSDAKKYAYYTALQNFLDDTIEYPCIFIATTNVDVQNDKDKTFPDPLLSRFQRKVKIEKPSQAYRLAIIQYYKAKNADIILTRQEEEELANLSSDFSIRDIESMFTLAAQHATQSPESAITMHNFRATLQTMKGGRRINIRRIAHVGLKALASCGGPAWLNFGLSILSMLIQHSQHLDDVSRSERHLYEDRIQHLQEVLFSIQQNKLQTDLSCQRTLLMDGVNHSRSLIASRDSLVQQWALTCFSQGLSVLSTRSQQQPAQPQNATTVNCETALIQSSAPTQVTEQS